MSIISPETIRVIAEQCGISTTKVSDEVAQVVLQEESAKYMKHSKRKVLSVENVNFALRALDFNEIFGHTARKNVDLRFVGLPGYPSDMVKVEDKVLNLEDITAEALPLCPRDCSLDFHWLAINGTQPTIPQNPVFENKLEKKRKAPDSQVKIDPTVVEIDQKKASTVNKDASTTNNTNNTNNISGTKVPADQILIIGERHHELSKDYQLYLEKIEETILAMSKIYPKLFFERLRRTYRADHDKLSEFCLSNQIHLFSDYLFNDKVNFVDRKEEVFAAAVHSLQNDPVAALLPYLMKFICEWYPKCLDTVLMLNSLTQVVTALLSNPFLNIQQHIHQLIPLIATCVIRPSLGNPQRMENHWALRDFASRLLVSIIFKFGNPENQIENRLTKTFVSYLQNSAHSFGSHYGAIRALSLMGHHYIEFVIIPSIPSLHSRAINSINANMTKFKILEETQFFLHLIIEIVGNYFREMMHFFQTLNSLSIVNRKIKEDSIFNLLQPKSQPSTRKCQFIPLGVKTTQNNFLKKKKIQPKEVQNDQLLSNQYILATQHFGEAFTPFFAEMIPEVNLFI